MAIASTRDLAQALAGQQDNRVIRGVADDVIRNSAPQDRDLLMLAGTNISPFFIPTGRPAKPISPAQWMFMVSQARAAAATTTSHKILVAAPMKTGSTFISEVLSDGLAANKVSLAMVLARPYDFVKYEAGMRALHADEMAIITACMTPGGFVAHHHMVCSPYLSQQLEVYGIRPVLITRNIFDCLISFENFLFKYRGELDFDGAIYFNNGMPFNWYELEFEDRISAILDRYLQLYVDYLVSWTECARRGLTKPLTISYENDIVGDKKKLADKLATGLGLNDIEAARLFEAMTSEKNRKAGLFNQGVAGRGVAIQGKNRERVIAAFDAFAHKGDWSELLT